MGQYSAMDANNLLRYGDRWRDVTKPLGKPVLPDEELRRLIGKWDTAMDHAGPLDEAVRTYRGVQWTPEELKMAVNKVFTDPAFSSTSAEHAVAAASQLRGNVKTILTMNVSPKVKAIWGANEAERELLLQRGCRYVVRKVEKLRYRWHVEVDVLPPVR
jgi:hypothetical protein